MKITVIVLLLALAAVFFLYRMLFIKEYKYQYEQTNETFKNPMMGFAPNADYVEAVGDNTLVYVDVTWRELEPEEGVYAFDAIEEENNLLRWREEGKKVVFRFVCDKPSEESHMDIPDWLYEKTGDGTFYDCAYGKGYSPDYTNQTLIAYHKKAIEALGAEYGGDNFFCFIELGSLGHWGEWHVNYAAGIDRFPSEEVCKQYVEPYVEAFPNAKLLMRRPFSFVTEYGLGVFNDMTGEPEDTAEWLEWIYNGGVYEEASEPMGLLACEDVWLTAPVGGEFTSSLSMEEMLVTEHARTIELLQESHMTFIGPMCPIANKEEMEYPTEVAEILKNVGYRYGVTFAKVVHNKLSGSVSLEIQMKNYGVAPMYFSWPVCVYLLDENGKVLDRQELDIELTKLGQNQLVTAKACFETDEVDLKTYLPVIAVGIENPETGEPEVFLDMDTEVQDKVYILNVD